MTNPNNHQPNTDTDATQRKSLGSRALVAAAFSVIGAKIGYIGTVMDVNHLFKDNNMTLGKKFRAAFSPAILEKVMEKVRDVMRTENTSMWYAMVKVNKFGAITTAAGVGIGAILGWARGGHIQNWHDIFESPLESTKIILGFQKPHAIVDTNATRRDEVVPERATESPTSNYWQQYVANERSSTVQPLKHI